MNSGETPETILAKMYNSAKLKRTAIIFILAGMAICFIMLLPPVQRVFFSFVDMRTSGTGLRASGTFDSRLMALMSLAFFGLVVFVLALCCLFSKAIAVFLDNTKNVKFITVLTAGTCVFLLGFISIFSYRYGWKWLNSDHSSEMILGKLLAEENVFVSSNWRYSTELRLIYQTLFTMPLFKIFGWIGNWALIRAFTILLNSLVLILSYLFLARQLKIQTKWSFITALFLLMPISGIYWDIVIFGGYYIFFVAQAFICLGLYFRLAGCADTKTALPEFILFTLLSFALGVQGIRSLLCIHIPFLIACIWFSSQTAQKKNFTPFMGCYGFVVCCIGFAVNYLLHFKYSFNSFESMRLENLFENIFAKFGQSLVCLAKFFGFSAGSHILSAQGIFSVTAIMGAVILIWGAFKSSRRIRHENNVAEKYTQWQFLSVFFVSSVIFNIFVFIITAGDVTDRFFIPFMAFYVPLTAVLFEYAENRYGHLKRVAIVSGIVLFVFGQGYLNFKNLTVQDENTARKGYIEYLLDNRLDYGFATFENANVTTELSNGKVELAGLEPNGLEHGRNQFRLQGWLNQKKLYNPSYHQGESFLLLTRQEWELARKTGRPFALLQPDYEDGGFVVIRYPSARIIYTEALDK